MNDGLTQLGRLALRHEGGYWNAYYAMPNTMDGAVLLGSIAMGAVTRSPARKAEFMALMREVVADTVGEKIGVRPVWKEPDAAPEAERSGHA